MDLTQKTSGTDLLDLRGLTCPLPALRARKRLAALPEGTELAVLADDPLARLDIPNMCRESGHALLADEAAEGARRFLIRRGARSEA